MPTWTDDNGDVVASTTFTDSKGRHYINGVEVHESVWDEYQRLRAERDRVEDNHLAQCRHAKEDLRGTVRELAELVRGAQEVMASDPDGDLYAWWEAAESVLEGLDHHTWTFTSERAEGATHAD